MLRYMGAEKLEVRAASISLLYEKPMTTKDLAQLYKGRGINYKIVRHRLGGPNPGTRE